MTPRYALSYIFEFQILIDCGKMSVLCLEQKASTKRRNVDLSLRLWHFYIGLVYRWCTSWPIGIQEEVVAEPVSMYV